jgi:hypothetical protein
MNLTDILFIQFCCFDCSFNWVMYKPGRWVYIYIRQRWFLEKLTYDHLSIGHWQHLRRRRARTNGSAFDGYTQNIHHSSGPA